MSGSGAFPLQSRPFFLSRSLLLHASIFFWATSLSCSLCHAFLAQSAMLLSQFVHTRFHGQVYAGPGHGCAWWVHYFRGNESRSCWELCSWCSRLIAQLEPLSHGLKQVLLLHATEGYCRATCLALQYRSAGRKGHVSHLQHRLPMCLRKAARPSSSGITVGLALYIRGRPRVPVRAIGRGCGLCRQPVPRPLVGAPRPAPRGIFQPLTSG